MGYLWVIPILIWVIRLVIRKRIWVNRLVIRWVTHGFSFPRSATFASVFPCSDQGLVRLRPIVSHEVTAFHPAEGLHHGIPEYLSVTFPAAHGCQNGRFPVGESICLSGLAVRPEPDDVQWCGLCSE